MSRYAVLSGFLTTLATAMAAQIPADTGAAVQDSAVRVFFDCPNYAPGCDFDFVRTEITWVNWVRNREDADVHALITTQETGGGGREYTWPSSGCTASPGKAIRCGTTRPARARRMKIAAASCTRCSSVWRPTPPGRPSPGT